MSTFLIILLLIVSSCPLFFVLTITITITTVTTTVITTVSIIRYPVSVCACTWRIRARPRPHLQALSGGHVPHAQGAVHGGAEEPSAVR